MPTVNPTPAALEAHGAALTALAVDLRAAHTAQWSEPLRCSVASEGRSGRIADPTARVALDERRLRVRAAIYGADSRLAIAADEFTCASTALRAALRAWQSNA
jgi:hypothetical protein